MSEQPERPSIEILACIDSLEQLVEQSKSMPLTHHKVVDEEAFFIATQRLKQLLPQALKEQASGAHQSTPAPHAVARLRTEETILLVVDVQEKLLPVIHHSERVEKNCALLLRAANQLQIPVLITEQYPERLGATSPSLRETAPHAQLISKLKFSACVESTLAALAKFNRKTVLLCGIEAHVCVLQTALDLVEQGYSVFAARDAISSRAPENAEIGWQRMMRSGVLPTSTESAVFELLQEAGTPDFKALLPFIK